jgi:hypothetical protein
MAKRDLKLNSLSRYTKESPNLVLEEHGHCEVPAGCGGVVLRWTNPHRSIPITFRLATTGESRFYLDGLSPESGRPMVSYGEHVIALRVLHPDPASWILLFAGIYDGKSMGDMVLSRESEKKVQILSASDGSWKYTTNEPGDDSWMLPGFDDATWKSMSPCDFPNPAEQDKDRYRIEKLREAGAQSLTIPEENQSIWIRKTFSLSRA